MDLDQRDISKPLTVWYYSEKNDIRHIYPAMTRRTNFFEILIKPPIQSLYLTESFRRSRPEPADNLVTNSSRDAFISLYPLDGSEKIAPRIEYGSLLESQTRHNFKGNYAVAPVAHHPSGENLRECYFFMSWGPAACSVLFVDLDGIRHAVEVEAEGLYEASVLGLCVFRKHDL